MSDAGKDPREEGRLSCSVCLKEIPPDVELTQEGQEYVHYFCGLECYQTWHERRGPGPGKGKTPAE